jgi:hypothetical protein
LDALPSSWLPPWLDFTLNLFEGSARVENKTPQVLYVTAITTSYGAPRVISQNIPLDNAIFRSSHRVRLFWNMTQLIFLFLE